MEKVDKGLLQYICTFNGNFMSYLFGIPKNTQIYTNFHNFFQVLIKIFVSF